MAGKRQPTDVVIANGRKHLSKSEEAELPPCLRRRPALMRGVLT